MLCNHQNHSFVVWCTCILWLMSMFAIIWSLMLFLTLGDMLLLTGMDLINAFVLLTGILMLPTNVYMFGSVAHGKRINHKATVVSCPLWLCTIWIIIIASVGAVLCIERIFSCRINATDYISDGMQNYRSIPKYKRFIDNLQWSFKCCGLNSFKDWFSCDWYDKIRDYEWDPSLNSRKKKVTDSVPLSCCKSGSCISNYLMELGTYSINTSGCQDSLHQIILVSTICHLTMFIMIILFELLILKMIMKKEESIHNKHNNFNVRHIMSVNDKFEASSGSCQQSMESDEDDDIAEIEKHVNACK